MSKTAVEWQKIGKDAFMAKHSAGFVHVMHVGGGVWSVTLNGAVKDTANSEFEGKALAKGLF